MLSPADFREIVSGRRRGLMALSLRCLLRVAETPYSLAVRARNWRYDRQWAESTRVEVPVISVGNITLGGTGKTPMVEWLAHWMRRQEIRASMISRGYGAQGGAYNDEALELEQRLPDVPHVQDVDRVAAAKVAIEELACQTILLDDAFQHRRIARDLDIVLVDALEPLGWGHVFPRGTLREPLRGLRRADVLVLTRADMLSAEQRAELQVKLCSYAPQAVWCEVTHAPRGLVSSSGQVEALHHLANQPIAAFAGVGNPRGFLHTLNQCGYQVAAFREFPDHHPYSREDVESLIGWGAELPVEALVCTHKDLVKINRSRLGSRPLWALAIGIEFLAGEAELIKLLRPLAERARLVNADY